MKTLTTTFYALTIIGSLLSCKNDNSKKSQIKETALAVTTYSPSIQQKDGISVSGSVSARQTAMVSTRVMGFVDKIYVHQGDAVRKGQLLISINSADINAKAEQVKSMITEAEAAYRNADRDYQRYKILRSQNSVSEKELENMELNRTSMKAKLQIAQQSLREVHTNNAYTQIRAPFAGVVSQKMIDEGSTATPGMPMVAIEQSGNLIITANVPELYIPYIKIGTSAQVEIKSLNQSLQGSIYEISPSASMMDGQYTVKIALHSSTTRNLKAGMYATIHLAAKTPKMEKSSLLVYNSSIVRKEQLTGVYEINKENRAILRWIRLGKSYGDKVEVISGLNGNEEIVEQLNGELYNGKKVKIIR